MKHCKPGGEWPKGKRIQIVRLGKDAYWNLPSLVEKAKEVRGTLTDQGSILLEERFTYINNAGGEIVHRAGEYAYNLNDFYYVDLDDPDENY